MMIKLTRKSGAYLVVALIISMALNAGITNAQINDPYNRESVYLSPVKDSPIPFTAVGVTWEQETPAGTSASILFRFNDGTGWSDWTQVYGDKDNKAMQDLANYSDFLPVPKSSQLQYKIILQSENPSLTPKVANLEFTYLNARSDQPVAGSSLAAATQLPPATLLSAAAAGSAKIISRKDWGADESLRIYTDDRTAPKLIAADPDFVKTFSDELKVTKIVDKNDLGQNLTWPLQYPEKVSKFVIHHTATTKDLDDPQQAIRNIYYWHTITKGWGDIGYNFIIDPKGNIYEGRAGGDGVVGGHAGKANIGSIGIAVLGNYQDNNVPVAVVQSLAALIKMKSDRFQIDPVGKSEFRGEVTDNILGHRDVMSTTCPGDKLYAYLPLIRNMAKNGFKTIVLDKRRIASMMNFDFSLQNTIPIVEFEPGGRQRIIISLKNTGAAVWSSASYLIVSSDQNSQAFLNTGTLTRSTLAGKEVKPGDTVSFSLSLQAGYVGGIAAIEVFPFIDGKTKIEKYISIPIRVKEANYNYEKVRLDLPVSKLKPGETVEARLQLKNTGSTSWYRDGANRVRLGADNPRDHINRLLASPGTRLATLLERQVDPGQTGTFVIKIIAPKTVGTYREYYTPVVEGVTWMTFKQQYLEINVYDPTVTTQGSGTMQNLSMSPGERKQFTLELKNGTANIWNKFGDNPVSFSVSTDSAMRLARPLMVQDRITIGQTAKLNITIVAPPKEGSFIFKLMPQMGNADLMTTPQIYTVKVSGGAATSGTTSATTTAPPSATTVAAAASNLIKIDLSFKGNPVISAGGEFALYDGIKYLSKFAKDEKVSVTYELGKYKVKGSTLAFVLSGAPKFMPGTGAVLRIDNYENRPAWDASYNDNEYRGNLYINYFEDALHVINELPLEDYLKGLAEINAKEPHEKIKAIIVLARSYAKYYMTIAEKFPGAPFNLTDDPQRSQKYLGYGFEKRNPTGVKAVNDTTGIVVTYNGKLIKTPYFSSDDGKTKSAQEVWGWTDTPYLKSVDDPGCVGKTLSGHGVGLSGCGSLYFANLGKTYDQIIKYYFQGVEVIKQ